MCVDEMDTGELLGKKMHQARQQRSSREMEKGVEAAGEETGDLEAESGGGRDR